MQAVTDTVSVIREPGRLQIAWKRYGRVEWFNEIVMILLSLGFFLVPSINLIKLGSTQPDKILTFGNLLSIPFIVLGMVFVYRFITILVNTDTVEVTPQEIRVRSRPLPAWDVSNPAIHRDVLSGVDAKVKVVRAKNSNRSTSSTYYEVVATLTDGKKKVIIGDSKVAEPIYFIANEINEFMNLPS